MTFLLDVNVIVALLDQDHIFNSQAHQWFEEHGRAGWATCPITENGVLRIFGHARYPNGPGSPAAASKMLRTFCDLPGHDFWADEISLLNAPQAHIQTIGSPSGVTDTYLLALAVHRRERLATFDRRLDAASVEGGAEALLLID